MFLLLFVFLFLLSLPTLISFPPFQPLALRLLSLSGYKVQAEKVKLSWFGSQYISKADLINANGVHVFHVDTVALDESLIKLIYKRTVRGPLSLKGAGGLLDVQGASLSLFSGIDEAQACKFTIGSLNLVPTGNAYQIRTNANIEYAGKSGTLAIDGLIADTLKKFSELPYFSFKMQNIPLQLLKPFIPSQLKPLLSLYPEGVIQAKIHKTEKNVDLSIESSLLRASFKGFFEKEFLHVLEPGTATVSLPQGHSWILPWGEKEFTISTVKPATLQVTFKEASLPLNGSIKLASALVQTTFSGATISGKGLPQPIQTEKALFTGKLKEGIVDVFLDFDANAGKKPIHLKFQSKFPLPSFPLDWLDYLFSESRFQLTTTHFPLELLENFDHFAAASYLGKYLDLSLDYSAEKKEGTLFASSDRFSLQNALFSFEDTTMSLLKPASFQITIPPQDEVLFSLKTPAVVTGEIETLHIPLNNLQQSLFKAHFSNEKNAKITSLLFSEKPLAAHLIGDVLIDKQGQINTVLHLSPENDLEKSAGVVTFTLSFPLKEGFQGAVVFFDSKTEQLKGKGEFVLNPIGLLKLRTLATLDYYPTIVTSKALGIDPILLPPKIRLKLQQCELPFFSERALTAKGELILGSFSTGVKGSELFLENVLLPFRVQGAVADLKASGTVERKGAKSPFQFDSKFHYEEKKGIVFSPLRSAEFSLRDFPQELLAFFAPSIEKLVASPLNGTLYYEDLDDISDGTLQVDIASQNAHLSGKFAIEKTQVKMEPSTPLSLSLKVEERALKDLRKRFLGIDNYITMITPSNVKMNFKQFAIPRSSEGSLLFHKGSYDLSLSAKPLHFFDRGLNESIQFQEIQAHIYGQSADTLLEADLSLIPKSPLTSDSYFRFTASLENGFDQEGHLRLDLGKLLIKGSSNDLRSVSFCGLFCPYPGVVRKLDTLIGEPLDARFYLSVEQKNGVMQASGEGPYGNVSLDGNIQNGVLHLNKPLTATIQVTNKLGPFVMSEIAPLFSGLYKSQTPLSLTISENGFSFPLFNYTFENVRIGGARFDSGRLTFEKSNEIQSLLGVLGTPSSKEVTVWLTPAFFSLNNGWVVLQRMDALIDGRYHIALWGKVNLLTNEIDMTIGLTKNALEKAFKIAGIKEGSMLQISLRGTTERPRLDKGEATAKITALIAASQVPSGVIGTIVDIATTVINPSPPPPTVSPFPWSSEEEQKPKVNEPPEKKFVETIEKETKKLFKRLLYR